LQLASDSLFALRMPQTYQEDTQHRGEFISGADAKTLIGRWFGKLFFDDTWPSDNAGVY
jgi:hypothetical protein